MVRNATLLRGTLLVDAVVFLTAALLNMGIRVPLGFADLGFSVPVWQAGTGEAVIGVTLLAADSQHGLGCHGWRCGMSALGIAIGLSSQRVQGAARDIHVVMVPPATIVFVLLMWSRRRHPATTRPEGDVR